MANLFMYKDKKMAVGDTITVSYKIKEGDKERVQDFQGILIRTKGNDENNRMITVRKISRSGIGVERIFPLKSNNIDKITLDKQGNFRKAKLYFVRNLSNAQIRRKLYRQK
jgi:large subunit ribosomal protein L19